MNTNTEYPSRSSSTSTIATLRQRAEPGRRAPGVKISDVKRKLKERQGLMQQEAMSTLSHLISNRWVKALDIHETLTARNGHNASESLPTSTTTRGCARSAKPRDGHYIWGTMPELPAFTKPRTPLK